MVIVENVKLTSQSPHFNVKQLQLFHAGNTDLVFDLI
jgi:hypothetical protein